jgi:hypothetical protein
MGGHDYPEAKIIDYDIEEESDLLDWQN